jgi:hypothetical protein
LRNWGLTEDQSAVMQVQSAYPADGILLISSFYLQFLVSNLASVPGGQLVNSPAAQSLGRCTQPNMHFKMKTLLSILLCLICVTKSYGQTIAKNYYGRIVVEFTKEKRSKKIYAKVEIKSAFPGGDSVWVQSIENNINQSNRIDKRVKKGRYIVSAKFILSKDSSLSDIACENDPGFGMCEEVIRALKKTKKWIPAEQGGKVVRDYRKG